MATSKPKRSVLLTDKTYTIEELSVIHQGLSINNYHEPTNEQGPHRPKMSQPATP